MDQVDPAAAPLETPAPPPEPSAAESAVAANDVSSFRDAKRAERTGKPAPVMEPAPAPEPVPNLDPDPILDPKPAAGAPPVERTLSKRQQETNDKIREAVERATAEHTAEIARLRAQLPSAPRSDPQPAPAPMADPEPDLTDATKYPEGQFDRQFMKDQARWEARQELREHTARQHAEQQRESSARAIHARDAAWDARMDAVEQADPQYWDKVSPAVRALRPFNALKQGERPTAHTVIAEEILRSPSGPQLALYLSAHPADLTRLSTLRQADLLIELGELRASFKQPPPAPPTKTLTSAPDPLTTLGTKSTAPANETESAVAADDFPGFRSTRFRERTAR